MSGDQTTLHQFGDNTAISASDDADSQGPREWVSACPECGIVHLWTSEDHPAPKRVATWWANTHNRRQHIRHQIARAHSAETVRDGGDPALRYGA